MFVLAAAVACFAAIVTAAGQSGREAPPALPVVTFVGLPGQLVNTTAVPQRPGPLPLLPVTRLDERGPAAQFDTPHAASLTAGTAGRVTGRNDQNARSMVRDAPNQTRIDGILAGLGAAGTPSTK